MSLLRYESQLREPLVDGNKTYHDVTEDICRPIEAKPGKLWYIGFFISVALLLFGIYSVYREVVYGIGQWNVNHYRRLGLGYYQLRLVGWYRSCRNAYLRDPFVVQARMENWCKPCCRSHDHLCCNVCGPISRYGIWVVYGMAFLYCLILIHAGRCGQTLLHP